MNEKRQTCCACVVSVLIVSTVAFGTIIPDHGWDGDGYGPGYSDGDERSTIAVCNTSNGLGWHGGQGWMSLTTDTAGEFTWEFNLFLVAETVLVLWDYESCEAYASGSVSANCKHGGDGYSASSYVSGSDDGGQPANDRSYGGYPGGIYDNGTGYFGPYESCSSSTSGVAAAYTPVGAHSTAIATLYAEAWVKMW